MVLPRSIGVAAPTFENEAGTRLIIASDSDSWGHPQASLPSRVPTVSLPSTHRLKLVRSLQRMMIWHTEHAQSRRVCLVKIADRCLKPFQKHSRENEKRRKKHMR
jgi:hypothetical protein